VTWKHTRIAKKKPGKGWWDEKKKLEVLQTYIILGNLRLSAANNNVPEITVRQWKATQWWKDREDELRRGSKLQLSAKLTDLVNKAMLTLADRIENGDYVYNRLRDEYLRKPISAEHANKITTQLIARVLMVEKAAIPEKINDEGLEARLTKLKREMLGFARVKVLPSHTLSKDIIDVIPTESLYLQGPENDSIGHSDRTSERPTDPARPEGHPDPTTGPGGSAIPASSSPTAG
jgi:hypothetical protein